MFLCEVNGDVAFVKGAPREILQLCTRILMNDQVVSLTNQMRAEIPAATVYHAGVVTCQAGCGWGWD
jgi:magnesium-transporting ATPase (P-type)